MADRIQLRRDTAANWTAYNPILLEGEPGIEIDTDQWKLGDGVHTWSQLAYRGGECVQQRGQSTTVAMSQKAVTDELNLIGVFDISAHNLTDGQPTKYADLTAALGTNGANVPEQYRVPGMTIRYVQSSDNNYVQYRLMSDEWSVDTNDWAISDEGVYIVNPEFAEVHVDAEDKILYGVKQNGDFYFGAKVPSQVQEELDNKVDKEEGKSLIDSDYALSQSVVENPEYIQVTTDVEGKMIEATKKDGKKVFFAGIEGAADSISDVINIPLLDANFTSPVPVTITGNKGEDDATYEFELPLKEAYNIRFQFLIRENLINQNKSCDIASLNGAKVRANVVPITAYATEVEYEQEMKTVHWPTTEGGIAFNTNTLNRLFGRRNIGQQAFSVKYLGEDMDATIENDGTAIILTINNVVTTYSFATYPTVNELYEAMSANTDIALQFIAMDKRNCDELMVFPAVPLRGKFYCSDRGVYTDPNTEHIDSAPFYLNYAVQDYWHQVEIVKIGDTIYCVCDGNVTSVSSPQEPSNILVLGGGCDVLFKNLEIHTDSSYDAEYSSGMIISSVNPYIAIFEVHGMYDGPAYTAIDHPELTEDYMSSMNVDTMDYILSDLTRKGYVPVSVHDIAQYYDAGVMLPKRCYTLVFDDERWPVCMNLDTRKVFTKYGCKPALAMITNRISQTTHNGVTITTKEASEICHAVGWDVVTHTRNHRHPDSIKPSQYVEFLKQDIYAADVLLIDGAIYVYPGGESDAYTLDTMEYLGFKIAMNITKSTLRNNTLRNRYNLNRINISRIVKSDGTPVDYTSFMNWIL